MVKQCDVVFLAVKPYQITAVLQEVAGEVNTDRHVIVSIAAGVVIKAMEEVNSLAHPLDYLVSK